MCLLIGGGEKKEGGDHVLRPVTYRTHLLSPHPLFFFFLTENIGVGVEGKTDIIFFRTNKTKMFVFVSLNIEDCKSFVKSVQLV